MSALGGYGNSNDGGWANDESWRNWLGSQAQVYESRARDAQLTAHRIDAEVQSLRTCLLPIKNLHTSQAWDSRAATQSRSRLYGTRSQTLNSLIMELENIAGQLNVYAYIWNTNSQNFLRLLAG